MRRPLSASVKRRGQSAAVRHCEVHPAKLAPRQKLLGQSAARVHGRSTSTHTDVEPTSEHAKPAGQSDPPAQSRVQWPTPDALLPKQRPIAQLAAPLELLGSQGRPVSSARQRPAAQT